ncbi:DUF4919 domain-containing protein [Terrimonas ferruginea]|uniref:DUF4919 domain-containing protein n=1 Tax=Terrimonas ferruginea TaxID=249 RepID=UPI00040CAF9B|nr:DUF4919 domain-containing protein [Terrimonas ferruginea]
MKKIASLIFTYLICLCAFAQQSARIVIPDFKDKYCEYIKKLEAGQTDIDYQDFRFSFIESEQFKKANEQKTAFDSLKTAMYNRMEEDDYPVIISLTKQMLSIDYTSMLAHKILRQAYERTGDTSNAAKYKTIQFGLLNSIVKKGDGKSCATGWPVIQISEEYFILGILDAKVIKQSLHTTGGTCDKMEVKVDGEKETYYFDVIKVFEGYKKAGLF